MRDRQRDAFTWLNGMDEACFAGAAVEASLKGKQ